jgi:hypothetical protein
MPLAVVVMHVARRYDAKLYVIGQIHQGAGQRPVPPHKIALQLDEEPLGSEHCAAALGEPAGGGYPLPLEDLRQQSVAAPREDDEPRVPRFERREIEPRVAAVLPAQMGLGKQPAEIRVPFRRLGEDRHVRTVEQRHFGAGNRLEAELLRFLRERHRAVEAVVVGERECRIAQLPGGERELFGQGGAVEEREGGVAVELGVHRKAERGSRNAERSRLLHEPLSGAQVFEQHHVRSAIEDHLDVAP